MEPSGWPWKQSSMLPSAKLTHTSALKRAETHAYTHIQPFLANLTWTPAPVIKNLAPHLVLSVGGPCNADGVFLQLYGAFTRLQTKAMLLQ